jgi:hypothetical protein
MKRSRIYAALQVAITSAFLTTATVDCFSPTVGTQVAPSGHPSTLLLVHDRHSKRLGTTALSYATSTGTSSSLPQNNHRHSSSDWLYNIQSIPSSTILKEVRHPVLAVFTWSTVVTYLHKTLLNASSSAVRGIATSIQLPGTAHSLLVSALGLLLVFRTNSAYQRFQVCSIGVCVLNHLKESLTNPQ